MSLANKMARRALCCFVWLASLAGTEVNAAEGPFDHRFAIDLGSYFMTSDTSIRVDELEGVGIGTRFKIENEFDFDSDTVFRLEGAWRFKPRHGLRLMYFGSERTRTENLQTSLDFGDETFPIGVAATMKFDFTVIELAYRYSLVRKDTFELDASFGVHNIDFNTALNATITSPGGQDSVSAAQDASTDAPLPVIGLGFTWRLAGDFYLQAHAQYFQVQYGDIDGSLQDYQGGILWQSSDHFGVGAAYNVFDLDVSADDADGFRGELDWRYAGPQLFIRASF
jgi:hypothetical protein